MQKFPESWSYIQEKDKEKGGWVFTPYHFREKMPSSLSDETLLAALKEIWARHLEDPKEECSVTNFKRLMWKHIGRKAMHEELELYHTEKEIPLAHLEEVQDQVNSGEYDEEFFEKQGLSGDTAFHQAIQTSSKHQAKKAKNHHRGRPKLNTPPQPSKQLAHQLNKWGKDVLASHSPPTKFKVIIYDNLPTHAPLMLDSLGVHCQNHHVERVLLITTRYNHLHLAMNQINAYKQKQRQLLINLKLETVLVFGYKPHHSNHNNKPQWCENGIFVAVWNKGQTQLQDDSSSITSSLLALETWQPTSVVIPIKGPQAQEGQVADQANLSSSPVPPLNVYRYLLNTFTEPKDVVLAFNPTTAMRHFVALFPGSGATNLAEHAKLLATTVLDRNKVQKGLVAWKKKQKVLKEDLVPKNADDEDDEVPKDNNQSEEEDEELPKLTSKNHKKSKAQQNEKDKSKEVEEEEEKEEEEEEREEEEQEDTENKGKDKLDN
ncbi:Digestive organ expansion factor [Balamuthia mandrillaris]